MNRILIFDAYPSIRELLAEELAADGYTVVPIGIPNSIPNLTKTFEPDLVKKPFGDLHYSSLAVPDGKCCRNQSRAIRAT